MYRKFIVLLFIFQTSVLLHAHVDKNTYLIATEKGKTTVMRLWGYDEEPSKYATIFDNKNRQNRYFRGREINHVFLLTEYSIRPNIKEITDPDTFRISENPDKSWDGLWISKSGSKKIHFEVLTIDPTKHKYSYHPYVNELSPYSWWRTSDLTFKTVRQQRIHKDTTLLWVKEPLSGLVFIRLKMKNKEQTDSVNLALELMHIQRVEQNFTFYRRFKNVWYCFKASQIKIENNILSFSVEESRKSFTDNESPNEIYQVRLSLASGRNVSIKK